VTGNREKVKAMKLMHAVTYRYREGLGEEGLRTLTKRFIEFGTPPGVIAHYERIDGKGGFLLQEVPEDPEAIKENLLRYAPWIDFEVFPVTTMAEAFPLIQRVYG
jgi:hypothetical protein